MAVGAHRRDAGEPPDRRRPPPARQLELRCSVCGYGAVVSAAPEVCPMCRQSAWDYAPWRPFTGLVDELRPRRRG